MDNGGAPTEQRSANLWSTSMGLMERYIFRQTAGAFLLGLSALAGVLYVTQALRELDIVTSQGQGLMIFLTMTALWMPLLVMIIAPVALLVASIYTLNRLNGDSELVVMTAAGVSQWRLLKPFLLLALIVSTVVASISLYFSPISQKAMRNYINEVRTDLVANILKEGRFTEIEKGLTFHIRERTPDGRLKGVLVNDERDAETAMAYLAEDGILLELPTGNYLVMENGNIQRRKKDDGRLTIVNFDRYSFDLSQFSEDKEVLYFKPREQLTHELLDKNNVAYKLRPGRVLVELHDRFSSPLYPLAFALIVLAALGRARTTRQARGGAIFLAAVSAGAVRLIGFTGASLGAKTPAAIALMYIAPIGAMVISLILIATAIELRLPAWAASPLGRAGEWLGPQVGRLTRRFGLAGGEA